MCNWCVLHNGEDVDDNWVNDDTTKGGKFDKEDAADETNTSTSKVAEAWHQAREDAQDAGELPEREENKKDDDED